MADALAKMKEELERKRKLLVSAAATTGIVPDGAAEGGEGSAAKKKKVYLTKGQARMLQKEIEVKEESGANGDGTSSDGAVLSPQQKEAARQAEAATKWIPSEQVILRLRMLKQPIRLFGESDEQRIVRLRQAELSRPEDEHEGGQKNWHIEKMKAEKEKAKHGDSSDEEELTHEQKQQKRKDRLAKLKASEDAACTSDDKEELIKFWLKHMLKEWEIDLEEIPEEMCKSVHVRKEKQTYHQTKEYLKPLFRQLKKRSLELDILDKIAQIVKLCRRREYVKAADAYLVLSIGKAAWPMGVTMVGIHERSSREKLFSSDVAHILNDETQRKFIQSVKRLMTYSQNKYPPTSFTQALEPTVSILLCMVSMFACTHAIW
jgi:pre-mRNA-splicing factor 18